MRSDFAAVFSAPAEFQFRRATVGLVGGNGGDRQFVLAVGQREAEAEGTVRTKFDLAPANRDLRLRIGRAVDDEFGVDVEPESFPALGASKRTGDARNGAGRQRELRRGAG